MTNIVVARLAERGHAVTRKILKPRLVHLQLAEAPNRYFAACASHLTLIDRPGRGLAYEPSLVSCPRCKSVLLAAMRAKAKAQQ